MQRNKLQELAAQALSVARENLVTSGSLLPVVITFTLDGKQKVVPVQDKNLVGSIIKTENPDAFLYVAEAWVRLPTEEERKLSETPDGRLELSRRFGTGESPMPSEDMNRSETILVIGGSESIRIKLAQLFRRVAGNIEFPEHPELTEIKLGESLVDWEPLQPGKSHDTHGVSPPGGSVFTFGGDMRCRVRIPEGWRMGYEQGKVKGFGQPYWYRDKNSHGILRVRVLNRKPSAQDFVPDPKKEAHARADQFRKKEGVENVNVEEGTDRARLSWTETNPEPGRPTPTRTHNWLTFDAQGAIFTSFSYESKIPLSEVRDELESAENLAKQVTRS